MSIDQFEVGTHVEAIRDFQIEEVLASPGGGRTYDIKAGDTGEVTRKQVVGNTQWLQVRWHRLRRTLNVDRHNLPYVQPVSS